MTSPAAHPRARRGVPGRWVLAVALVLGVLGMHALVGPTTTADAAAQGPTAAASGMGMGMGTGMGVPAGALGTAPMHGGSSSPAGDPVPAGGHSMLMSCLAVLGAVATLLLFVAAVTARWWALEVPVRTRRRSTVVGLGRPPPWTVPTLHQLSLLRV